MVNIVSFSYTLSVQMYGFLSKRHNFANDFRHTAHIYAKICIYSDSIWQD